MPQAIGYNSLYGDDRPPEDFTDPARRYQTATDPARIDALANAVGGGALATRRVFMSPSGVGSTRRLPLPRPEPAPPPAAPAAPPPPAYVPPAGRPVNWIPPAQAGDQWLGVSSRGEIVARSATKPAAAAAIGGAAVAGASEAQAAGPMPRDTRDSEAMRGPSTSDNPLIQPGPGGAPVGARDVPGSADRNSFYNENAPAPYNPPGVKENRVQRADVRGQDNYDRNQPYLAPGDHTYNTRLNEKDEGAFRQWLSDNKVPFNTEAPVTDYDMRGFWKDQQDGHPAAKMETADDGRMHFSDYYKTPYHETFSSHSQWADPDNQNTPRWEGDQYVRPDELTTPQPQYDSYYGSY